MSDYECTHCGRAPVLEDTIEDLEAEVARLKEHVEQLAAEHAELRSDEAERWDEEARKEQTDE